MRTALVVVVMFGALSLVGCSKRIETLTVRLGGDPDATCIARALQTSRSTGYIEQTVDKESGFFRVIAKSYDAKRRPGGMQWINITCINNNTVSVTPMNGAGIMTSKASKLELNELRTYALRLGAVVRGGDYDEPAE